MKITKERLEFIQNYLVESNALLDHYHSKVTTDSGRLGFRIIGTEIKFNKIDFVNFISSKDCAQDVEINGVVIPQEHAEKIANSKKYESEILLNYMHMFSKIASKWSSYFNDVCLSKEDLEGEAIEAAMCAIYGYLNKQISFTTYLYSCVINKIKNICNTTNRLSNFGSRAIKIRRKFEEAKNLNPFCSYDEIIKNLGLDEKEVSILQSMCVASTSLEISDEEGSNDYSCLGKKFSGLDGSVTYTCTSSLNGGSFTIHQDEKVKNENQINIDFSEFSELEKAVLEGFMNSSNNLGISIVAKNLINPRTGKPYSRMACTYAWKRIKEKIKKFSSAA